jgi:pantoate--beta-alanine ligase
LRIVSRLADLNLTASSRVGFVPTMGAFHAGHLRLMERAKEDNDLCVVSLFVNPTQFGKNEDFDKYPRDLDRDAMLAEEVGVDYLFAPSVSDVYPRPSTTIRVPVVTEMWEGAQRPGHFDGVATVVCKLFNMVRPQTAYFGLKDLQQCIVIKRMTEDLNMAVLLKFEPTVREADGLAMSSRNVYLSGNERQVAPLIYQELRRCRAALNVGEDVASELRRSTESLGAAGFSVDYFALVDTETMHHIEKPVINAAIIAAAKLGSTRLIDNILL